jgi:maltose-binding protein MalE
MTDYVNENKDKFIEATLETATYDGKIWGAPSGTNAAFLHLNTERSRKLPPPGRTSMPRLPRRAASSSKARPTKG